MARAAQPKRIRRSAEDARKAILDATEHRLAEVGPAAVRIQDVANDVGMSHPTVLHHFGSRESLIAAVVDRCVSGLHEQLVAEILAEPQGDEPIKGMLEAVARVLGPGGQARIAAWLTLSGFPPDERGSANVQAVAKAAHELRRARRGETTPPYEDTYYVILLAGLALFGDAIAGKLLRPGADEAALAEEGKRFRAWLAVLLNGYLATGGIPDRLAPSKAKGGPRAGNTPRAPKKGR